MSARRGKTRTASTARYVKSSKNGKVAYRTGSSGFGVTKVNKKNTK